MNNNEGNRKGCNHNVSNVREDVNKTCICSHPGVVQIACANTHTHTHMSHWTTKRFSSDPLSNVPQLRAYRPAGQSERVDLVLPRGWHSLANTPARDRTGSRKFDAGLWWPPWVVVAYESTLPPVIASARALPDGCQGKASGKSCALSLLWMEVKLSWYRKVLRSPLWGHLDW